ncbi:MAG: MFS transporter [Actinomycetes bacterium]
MTAPRRSALALAATFALFGFLVGTWISRIPAVKDNLALSNRTLGLALLGWPLGSVAASLAVPRWLSRVGSRPVVVIGAVASAVALVLPAFATNAVELAVAMFVFGLATGALDIAANTHAAAVESAYGRSVFARLHASWSAGAFIGAGLGAVAAAADVGVRTHFVVVACFVTAAAALVGGALLPANVDRRRAEQPATRSWSLRPAVVLLGVIALVGFVVEAAIADWAAIYLHENIGTTLAVGAAGYATFAAVHLSVRFAGDRIMTRVDRVAVMQIGCIVAAAGYALLLGVPNVLTVFLGLAIVGAGIAAVVPAAFGAAGQLTSTTSAVGVATVTGISYVGWAAAPPLIGVLAGDFTLRAALLVPLVLALVGAGCARLPQLRVTLNSHAGSTTTSSPPR